MDKNFVFKKSLGQNFLKDVNIISKILKESEVDSETLVIEIGPGQGSLSKELALKCKNLICYEIDSRLKPYLEELENKNNVKIYFKDFLEADINADIKEYQYKKLYVVANIPYYITTPIIEKLIKSRLNFDKIILMVQEEVGNRITSKENSRNYNSLSVYINYYFDTRKLFTVNKKSFIPVPKVDSSVIELSKKDKKIEVKKEEKFFKLVHDSFVHKRKTLKNNLYNYDLEKISKILKKYNLDLTVRAENLSIEIFAEIANNL